MWVSVFMWVYGTVCGSLFSIGRRCPSMLLRGTIGRFTGLPKVNSGATVHLMLRLLQRRMSTIRDFKRSLVALGRRIGCYAIYRGLSSARIYKVYTSTRQSRALVYIIRGVRSIVTVRGARRCGKMCRILNKIVSPVSNINPSSLRVRSLIRHIHRNRIHRIVLTLDPAVRKSAAGFCVCEGVRTLGIGVDIVTQKITRGSRLRCASRIALKHSVIGHIAFGKRVWSSCKGSHWVFTFLLHFFLFPCASYVTYF